MDKPKKVCMFNTAEKYQKLDKDEKIDFQIRLLNKIYASFFVFDSKIGKEISSYEIIKEIINGEFEGYSPLAIINMGSLIKSEDIEIGESYASPFLQIEYSSIKYTGNDKIKNIFDDFISRFYRYVCVSEIMGKIIIFTDIGEDFLQKSFKRLDEIGYKKIEIHSIIPKIVDLLAENIHNIKTKDSIREMGIHFPLSMLGNHSEIIGKIKDGKHISNDNNFKKLISYGLLDAVKISTDFNVSFNNDNDSDKYRLFGFLYSKNKINSKVFIELSKFLEKVDGIQSENENNNFAGLPIYVINDKKIYENKENYPYFTYIVDNDNRLKLELIFEGEGNDTIKGAYIITGIYPQYFKERFFEDIKGEFCYLKKRDDKRIEWGLSDEIIKEIFDGEKKLRCEDFLNEVRKGFAVNYFYEPNTSGGILNKYNHPDVTTSDLFLTAINEEHSKNDYLINITTPKRANAIKLGHKITVNIFKLSSFNFDIDNIKNIIKGYYPDYNGNTLIRTKLYGTISKIYDKEGHQFQLNGEKIFNISIPCDKKGDKKGVFKVTDVGKDNINLIKEELRLEDIWSYAFIELLKINGHKAFFGGRVLGGKTRELADIISIQEYENKNSKKCLNINLFHMKKEPFEQIKESTYSIAFSTYTVVIGQVLEKIKSFLFQKDYNGIISSLELFFDKGNKNYEIYKSLVKSINENRNNIINFNIYFPIKEKDYFYIGNIETNSNNKLSLETNWKRLKIINDIFKSNVDNVNGNDHKMKINLNLGLVICKSGNRYNQNNIHKGDIETNIKIINDINKHLF